VAANKVIVEKNATVDPGSWERLKSFGNKIYSSIIKADKGYTAPENLGVIKLLGNGS